MPIDLFFYQTIGERYMQETRKQDQVSKDVFRATKWQIQRDLPQGRCLKEYVKSASI